jgi:hypothetical protein
MEQLIAGGVKKIIAAGCCGALAFGYRRLIFYSYRCT